MSLLRATSDEVLLGAGIEAIYAGVDWISCSLPRESPGHNAWYIACLHVINTIAKEGYDLEAFTRNGYRGWGTGGSFLGYRDDGSYLQLSGHYAGEFLDSIHNDDLHISRLDIQATVKYRQYAPGVGEHTYRAAVDANGALLSARRRKVWYMSGDDGGWTTYIGSPTSEQRAKVYNKAVQSGKPEYERSWRWEVTAKNEYATAWYRSVIQAQEARPRLCASICASWFALRGVKPDWSAYVSLISLPLIKEVPSDAEKRLRWLAEQVRPAVAWLISRGYGREAIEALALDTHDGAIPLPIQEQGGGQSDA